MRAAPRRPTVCSIRPHGRLFDAALCLYHDQGLIPVKMLDFWGGVNLTLGLPVVRTWAAPDFAGTAFDIAGKGARAPTGLDRRDPHGR